MSSPSETAASGDSSKKGEKRKADTDDVKHSHAKEHKKESPSQVTRMETGATVSRLKRTRMNNVKCRCPVKVQEDDVLCPKCELRFPLPPDVSSMNGIEGVCASVCERESSDIFSLCSHLRTAAFLCDLGEREKQTRG